jgi:hypothetical protein
VLAGVSSKTSLKLPKLASQRCEPTRLVANLFLADQVEFLESPQDPRHVIFVVEVARVDANQTVAIGHLAWRDLSSDA